MGISLNEWAERISSRSDLTGRITHLTKPNSSVVSPDIADKDVFSYLNRAAVDNLLSILIDKTIGGSDCGA